MATITTTPTNPVSPPPIVEKLFVERPSIVNEKDKSIHSQHGVIHYPFWFGGVASCASTCCTQPLGVAPFADTSLRGTPTEYDARIWPDMDLRGRSRALEGRMKLSASLTRAILYSGMRFGMYEKLKEMSSSPTHAPAAHTLATLAATSGFCGSLVSNFADVVCLRMQNDPGLPLDQQRRYKSIGHGVVKMIQTEGWASIWTGVWVGAGRAAIATATQLAGYDVIKRELMARTTMGDNIPTHITASCMAGFLSTFICSPLDVFKARVMTRKTAHSMSILLSRIYRDEGLTWMFKGLTPALISRAPSTIITFVAFEQLKRIYRRIHDLEE